MAIVQELNESYFIERFREMGRGDQFTRDALEALYAYYTDLSEDLGEDIKLDVIGICCDWYESTVAEVVAEYAIEVDLEGCESEEDIEEAKREAVIAFLQGETSCIDVGETVLYMAF